MGSYSGGKWKSLKEKVAEKKTTGPKTRGGKRTSSTDLDNRKFAREIVRQSDNEGSKPSPKKAAPAKKASSYATKPIEKKAEAPKSRIKRSEVSMAVKDLDGPSPRLADKTPAKQKPDKQIGGLVGRTGGKWHLGRKVGKG